MISENRLRALAREQEAGVGLMEKDYVNSWILYAIFQSSFADKLLFKGGTALSKLYFPQRWRFSEDLDFTATERIGSLIPDLEHSLNETSDISGIGFRIRDSHHNPDYTQLKIQYDAILQQKNTTDLDLFEDELVYFSSKKVTHSLEDLPEFNLGVYALEEIFVEKLRSLFQRARARDYYDLYWLIELKDFDKARIKQALEAKAEFKDLKVAPSEFPGEQKIEDVRNYWDRALDRFTNTKPDFDSVLEVIKAYMKQLWPQS